MNLSSSQALELQKFKARNKSLLQRWQFTFPYMRHVPPIYWNPRNSRWYWSDVAPEDVRRYVAVCEAMMQAKKSGE